MKLAIILLILAGAAGLAYGASSYWTDEVTGDLGSVHAAPNGERTNTIPLIVGGIAVVTGLVLLIPDKTKPSLP